MAIDHGHEPDVDRNPGVEYDKTDLGARGILIFFAVLAVFALAIHLTVLALYAGMTRIADKHEPEISPLAPQTYVPRSGIMTNTANVNVQQFPQPRLLIHPNQKGGLSVTGHEPGEMTDLLDRETAVLTAAPWQDAQGNVHLPIDLAMKRVLSRLPVRAGGVAPPNYPGVGRTNSYPGAPMETALAPAGAASSDANP